MTREHWAEGAAPQATGSEDAARLGSDTPYQETVDSMPQASPQEENDRNRQREESRAFWENQARAMAASRGARGLSMEREESEPTTAKTTIPAKSISVETKPLAASAAVPRRAGGKQTAPVAAAQRIPAQKQKSGSRVGRFLAENLPYMVLALLVALALRIFVFEIVLVNGPSMEPTLWTNERVWVDKTGYWGGAPSSGDIVVCRFPDETALFVKRVVGVGGDTVEVREGKLYINGQQQDPNPNDVIMQEDFKKTTVRDGYVFVMGDNRNRSRDSRMVGEIAQGDIIGRARFIVFPFDQWRALE